MTDLPSTLSRYESEALNKMSPKIAEYVKKAAGLGKTNMGNISAYDKYCIVPSVLRGLGEISTGITLFGSKIKTSIMIAPVAWHELYHPDKETAAVKAAKEFGTTFVVSSFSTQSFDELKRNCGSLNHVWYQTIPHKDIKITEEYISRAREAGVSAVVLLVDAPSGCTMCSVKKAPVTGGSGIFPAVNSNSLPLLPMPKGAKFASLDDYYSKNLDSSVSKWDNIKKLIKSAKIPVVLKGILSPEDAYKAKQIGASGIIISNHGGRQLDKVIPTLLALKNIMNAGKNYGNMQIYVDGGLKCGQDVFIAHALGANGVFIGRSAIYGIVVGSKEGLKGVLNLFTYELAQSMQQTGCSMIKDINKNCIQEL